MSKIGVMCGVSDIVGTWKGRKVHAILFGIYEVVYGRDIITKINLHAYIFTDRQTGQIVMHC